MILPSSEIETRAKKFQSAFSSAVDGDVPVLQEPPALLHVCGGATETHRIPPSALSSERSCPSFSMQQDGS